MMTKRRPVLRHEQGMALVVSLVILLSLTLLGLAAIQNTSLEERMAGGFRSEQIALQAAEAALREGEAWLNGLGAPPGAQGAGGSPGSSQIWLSGGPDELTSPDLSAAALVDKYGTRWWFKWSDLGLWDDANDGSRGVPVTNYNLEFVSGQEALSSDATRPRYVIEEFASIADHLVIGQQRDLTNARIQYLITARGVDAGGRSEVLLGSRYQRRY
jgi:type IV pilus assembly protein PilX